MCWKERRYLLKLCVTNPEAVPLKTQGRKNEQDSTTIIVGRVDKSNEGQRLYCSNSVVSYNTPVRSETTEPYNHPTSTVTSYCR